MLKKLLCLTFLTSLVNGELLQIKNVGRVDLIVSVTGLKDFKLKPGKIVPVTVPEDFTGHITAVPKGLGKVKTPKTKVELTLSPMGDAYDISIIDGFNIEAKITPLQGRRCKAAKCTEDINSLCSSKNQVSNGKGTVIGCYSSPFLFKALCPEAVVTLADVTNVFTCTTDSYFITLG